MREHIVFVSTMSTSSWGGSEELWCKAALDVLEQGYRVTANIHGSNAPRPRVDELRSAGVVVHERMKTNFNLRPKPINSVAQLILRSASRDMFKLWLQNQGADLICVSSGDIQDGLGLIRHTMMSGRRYAIIVHANAEHWWPDDKHARTLIDIYSNASCVFFVANRNRELLETQLGIELANSELVRNPYNVPRKALPWPAPQTPLRLACVARLDPASKGQDLILHLLAREPWSSRPVTLSFYGAGDAEESLQRLAERLGLSNRVHFCGHVSNVESIWMTNHALVLPSRYEGLPLAIIEAMLCGRPVITTDVAGNAEVIEDGVTGFIAEAPTCRHLGDAMDRAWANRGRLPDIGRAAANAIRELVPDNPGRVFAQRLVRLLAP